MFGTFNRYLNDNILLADNQFSSNTLLFWVFLSVLTCLGVLPYRKNKKPSTDFTNNEHFLKKGTNNRKLLKKILKKKYGSQHIHLYLML